MLICIEKSNKSDFRSSRNWLFLPRWWKMVISSRKFKWVAFVFSVVLLQVEHFPMNLITNYLNGLLLLLSGYCTSSANVSQIGWNIPPWTWAFIRDECVKMGLVPPKGMWRWFFSLYLDRSNLNICSLQISRWCSKILHCPKYTIQLQMLYKNNLS